MARDVLWRMHPMMLGQKMGLQIRHSRNLSHPYQLADLFLLSLGYRSFEPRRRSGNRFGERKYFTPVLWIFTRERTDLNVKKLLGGMGRHERQSLHRCLRAKQGPLPWKEAAR